MANPTIYDGTPIAISGSTPFGYYDLDTQFQSDGPKVANYCARKLGYPVMDVELQDLNIYACFEEAVSVYSPYVPLIMTPLVYDPNTFTPRKGIMTRYAMTMIRPEFYGLVVVSDLQVV